MSDSKKSDFAFLYVTVGLIACIIILVFALKDSKRKLADKDSAMAIADSLSYHTSKQVMEENSMLREKVGDCDKLKGDVLNWVSRAANAWDRERRGYLRRLSEKDSIITELRKHIQ
jgi:hypothetical protein